VSISNISNRGCYLLNNIGDVCDGCVVDGGIVFMVIITYILAISICYKGHAEA